MKHGQYNFEQIPHNFGTFPEKMSYLSNCSLFFHQLFPVAEDKLLRAEKIRLEKALDATATPLMIATDCLKNRERRQDIDHVHDNVEVELHKVCTIVW